MLFIFPVILFAGSIDISLYKHSGESSYIVKSDDIQNLKSELHFPFKFNSIDLSYSHSLDNFSFILSSSFLLSDTTTMGKDFDWQNDTLTVFSSSNNKTDHYYNIGITVSKSVFDSTNLFAKFNYKLIDSYWINTYQKDYVKNENEHIKGKTLKYKQEFYQYFLGVNYKNSIAENILLEFKPSFIYAFIYTKDTHLLRDFYTRQNIKTFGYEIALNLNYKITLHSNMKVSFSYADIKDKNVNMDYYNSLNEKYLSFPSSYSYKNSIVGIAYNYKF